MKQLDINQRKISSDILLASIGNFGRWQCLISILMSLLKFPTAWFQLGIVFLAPPTEFWCKPPKEYASMETDQWKKLIHWNKTDYKNPHLKSGCTMWDINTTGNEPSLINCPWGYEYDRSQIHTSIITEWDLVCGQERLVELTQVTLMFGVLLGSLIFGVAADKFGRKKVLLYTIALQAVCGVLSALTSRYWAFVLLRLIVAMANGGTMITSFVMCMEVVGGTYRTVVPILYQIPFGIGNSLMALLAYWFRDWRDLQLIISGLSCLFIVYIFVVPESPRWLLAVGRNKEAKKVLQEAARLNKVNKDVITNVLRESQSITDTRKAVPILAVLSTPQLRKRAALLCSHWFLIGITFFGFTQYLGHIGSNIYFAVALGGLIAIPGSLACIVVVKACGRRSSIAGAHILTGLCFFAILAVPKGAFPHDWLRLALAGIGVGGLAVSAPALYLFTGELYPTVVRNAGVGGAVMCSKFGSMLAPLVLALGDLAWYIPLLVLGCMSVIEAFLVIPLPETLNTKLLETIEDLDEATLGCDNSNQKCCYVAVPKNAETHDC